MNRQTSEYEPWIVLEDQCCLLTQNLITSQLSEKFRLLPKAQQRLISAIKVDQTLIEPDIDEFFKTQNWLKDKETDLLLHISKLKISPGIEFNLDSSKWCVQEKPIRINKNKQAVLRESLKLTEKSKIWLSNCIRAYKNDPIVAISKVEGNPFLISIMEPIIDKTQLKEDRNQWSLNRDSLDIFDEQIEIISDTIKKSTSESPIPSIFFVSDLKMQTPTLAESTYHGSHKLPSKFKKQWNFIKELNWIVDSTIIQPLVEESISKFEIKFKLLITPISVLLNKYEENQKPWKVSTYKAYMLNWKMFANWNLEEALKEDIDGKIILPKQTQNVCRYIRLKDLTRYEIDKLEYKNETISLLQNIENPIKMIQPSPMKSSPSATIQQIPVGTPDIPIPSITKTPQPLLYQNTPYSPNNKLHQTPPPISIFTSPPQPEITVETEQYHTSDICTPKHLIDEMDSLVMRKKKRIHKTVILDNKRYPYLDVFNQTTTHDILSSQLKEKKSFPESKEVIHLQLPQINTPVKEAKDNDILDLADEKVNITLLTTIPDNKKLYMFVNITFSDRFGAGFFQLSKLLADQDNLELLDFADTSDTLQFDMFLNPQCGVIFLRQINVYQKDLKTGENMILKQISEIAHMVTSLVLVITVDATLEPQEDNKVAHFVRVAESYGIQVFVIENNPKSIALSMIELAIKYGKDSKSLFEWTSEHQFLEACGVINPWLQGFILDQCTMEDFVTLDGSERARMLEGVCSKELVELVNAAIQRFHEI